MVLNHIEIPRLFSGLTFRVGSAKDAVAFRSPIYEATLGSAGIDRADDLAAHLVAVDHEGQIRACLRVEGPDCRPFSVESYVDLGPIATSEDSVAEISRFVVHPDVRAIRSGQFVHLGMLKLVYEYAVKFGLTDLVTLSLPHLNRLYEMALFRSIGSLGIHRTWGEVQPMHLNLVEARIRSRQRPSKLTALLFDSQLANVIV